MTAVRPSKIQRLCRRAPSLLLLGFLFAEVSSLLPAQRWSERFALSQRRRAGIGYDPSRDRLVLFGGTRSRATTFNAGNVQETYEWDGLTWTRRTGLTFIQPTPSDSTRAMVLDPFTRRVLLLNNNPTTVQMELYRFEGRLWQSVSTPTRPNYRQHYAGAFDEERRRLVAWGGSTQAGGAELDVWEYNGVEWFRIGAPGPAGRNDPALAWDGVRGKVIMFGGRTTDVAPTPLADMWEWNGAIWTRITPATLPPARSQHSMTWDPDRRKVVLFGGGIGVPGSTFNDTWEWDGTNWARATTAVSPPARAGHGAAYHLSRQRLVITCGEGGADLLADTWEFDGTAWVETTPPDSPAQRSDHGAAFDNARGNMVLFGGRDFSNQALGDTWLWSVASWARMNPATSPSARYDLAMAFDSARGNTVLFGGLAAGAAQNDTWTWDGTTWSQANPATRPSPRYGHAMTYDSARGRVVLFGGSLSTGVLLNDTWEWDGSTWAQQAPTASPTARADQAMAFDPVRNHIVMFGGRSTATTYLQEIWTYQGTTWTRVTPGTTTQPTFRGNMGFDYDPIRAKMMVFGGTGGPGTYRNDGYEWNGTSWEAAIGTGPSGRGGQSMVWDAVGRRLVLFGGEGGSPVVRQGDTWVRTSHVEGLVGPPIAAPGCRGPSGEGQILGFGDPSLGNVSFALDLTTPNPPTPASPVFYFLSVLQGSVTYGTCQLVVDPATLFYTAYRLQSGPFATLRLPIPSASNLIGASFFTQCLFIDPPTQLNGVAFSQGARVTIGDF